METNIFAPASSQQLALSFNTLGMFHAKLQQGGTPQIAVYRDEP